MQMTLDDNSRCRIQHPETQLHTSECQSLGNREVIIWLGSACANNIPPIPAGSPVSPLLPRVRAGRRAGSAPISGQCDQETRLVDRYSETRDLAGISSLGQGTQRCPAGPQWGLKRRGDQICGLILWDIHKKLRCEEYSDVVADKRFGLLSSKP